MQLHRSFVGLAVLIAFTKAEGAYSSDPNLTVRDVLQSESVGPNTPAVHAPPLTEGIKIDAPADKTLRIAVVRRAIDSCTDGTVQCCVEAKYAGDSYIQRLFQVYDISSNDMAELVGVDCGDPTGDINDEDDEDFLCSDDAQVPLCCKQPTYGGVMSRECEYINTGDDKA